jgi:sugar porter (SP) family MFS transporter
LAFSATLGLDYLHQPIFEAHHPLLYNMDGSDNSSNINSFYLGYAPRLKGVALTASVAISSAFTFLLFGYDQGVFGGLIATPILLHDMGLRSSDALLQGNIVSIYDIGCLIGCILCAYFGLKMGRRIFIITGSTILILGAAIQGAASGYGMMITGRIIAGIGTGIETTMIPIWVSECAMQSGRGSYIAIQMSVVLFGLVVAYWIDFGTTTNLIGSVQWRFPLAFQAAFCLLTLSTILFLPESPRYLYEKGFLDEADHIMARIYSVEIDNQLVLGHRREVLEALKAENEYPFKLIDLIWDSSPLNITWRVWICVIIQCLQQLGGINLVAYYASYIFIHSLGMDPRTAALTSGGLGLVFWSGSLTSIFTVDRLGRRTVLLWGAVACTTFMILFTIGLAINTTNTLTMSIVAIFLFEFSFGASWCIVPWMYSPEVTPLEVRHVGTACAVGMEWLMTFVTVFSGPVGITNCGWRFYLLFCIGNILQIVFVFFCVKETKGLTLEEIDILYAKPAYRAELEERIHSRHGQDSKSDEAVHQHEENTNSQKSG